MIEFICRKDHPSDERQDFSPVLTVHEQRWSWCVNSGLADHEWVATEAGSLDDLRLRERARRLEESQAVTDSAEPSTAQQ